MSLLLSVHIIVCFLFYYTSGSFHSCVRLTTQGQNKKMSVFIPAWQQKPVGKCLVSTQLIHVKAFKVARLS